MKANFLNPVRQKKGYNFETFENRDKTFTSNFHAGHIHYKDKKTGEFKKLDWKLHFDEEKRGWTFDTHSFKPLLPEYADEWIEFRDLYHDKDQTVSYRAQASHVKGEYFEKLEGVTENNGVLYKNAFGEGKDLILYFTRSTLKKVVRVREEYKGSTDLSFDFEIDTDNLPVFRKKGRNIEYELELKGRKRFDTNKETVIGGEQGDGQEWFTYLRTYVVWDSENKSEVTPVEFFEENGKFYLRKIITANFQQESVGDIFTDTTTSYYTGAGDGFTGSDSDTQGTPISQTAWDTIHDASANISFGTSYTGATMYMNSGVVSSWMRISRLYFPIDTSAIPDTDEISAASLYFWPTSITDTHSDAYRYLRVVQTTQASTASLVDEDYDQCGAVNNPTAGASDTLLSSLATGSYQHIDLNATGLGWISKTGYTKLGIRGGHDTNDIYINSGVDGIIMYASEQTGTDNDPYLSVTYAPPSTPWEKSLSDSQSFSEALANKATLKVSDALSISEAEVEKFTKAISDSISISESLEKAWEFKISLSDTLSISETLANQSSARLSDSVSITEAEVTAQGKKISDSISISENIAFAIGIKTSLSDSISFAEALATRVGKTVSDSQSISETLANQTAFGLSDSQSISESVDTVKEYYLSLSDSQSIAENLVAIRGQFKTLSDTQSIAESTAISVGKIVSDTQAIVETIANQSSLGISDSISITESIAKRIAKPKLAASISFAAAVPVKLIGKKPSDSISLSEGVTTLLALGIPLSDSISFSESLVTKVIKRATESFDLFAEIAKSVVKPITDTVSIAEISANQGTLSLSDAISIAESEIETPTPKLTDSINISESLSIKITKNPSDALSMAESLVKDLVKPLSDAITIAEQLGNAWSVIQSDSISISENLTKSWAIIRSLIDSQSIAEAEAKDIVKVLADSVEFNDSDIKKRVRFITDSVTPTDEDAVKTIVKVLSDSESLSDSEGATLSTTLSDSISITEAPVTETAYARFLNDSVSFSESLTILIGVFKAETESITENVGNSYTLSISDAISISESVIATYNFPLFDSLTITEAINYKEIVKNLTDNVEIADSSVAGGGYKVILSDSISIIESLVRETAKIVSEALSLVESMKWDAVKNFTEDLTIVETFAKVAEYYLSLTESISISDTQVVEHGVPLSDSIIIAESISGKSFVVNKTESLVISEDYDLDKHPQERIGQMGFLRTVHM